MNERMTPCDGGWIAVSGGGGGEECVSRVVDGKQSLNGMQEPLLFRR